MKKIYTILMSGLFAGAGFSQNCTTPQLTIPPVSACGQSTATINATTTGTEVKWYDTAAASVPIYLGNSFTTPAITGSTSYWAEAYNYDLGAQVTGGKTTPSTGSSAVAAISSPWGLAFTATSSFMLESVDVFASASGTLELELLDVNYVKIAQKSVTIPAGGTSATPLQFTVPVNFSVAGGNSYKLVARSSPSMRRDTGSSNSFPYALGTLGSITGGTINSSNTNSTTYYYFYNWKAKPITATCASGKIQTTVTVSTATPAPTAVATQTVPPTSTLADLSVSGQNLTWYSSAAMTTALPSNTVVSNGTTYYVTQTANGCQSATTAITVTTNLSTSDLNLEKQIKIYPNPVSDILIIESKDTIGSISIFDSSGKLIEVVNTGENKSKINVNSYTKGKYILKIETKNGTQVFPFIKK